MNEEVVVVGFDGMDMQILEEAMEQREMPNFRKLKNQGFITQLDSSEPPTTIPAWPSMFTGKSPGKLGFFHFQKLDRKNGSFSPVDLESAYGQYIWDQGIETSLVFVPGITPPYEINGRVIEGPPGPANPRTYPEQLRDELEDKHNFEVFETDKTGLDAVMHYFQERKKIAKTVLEKKSQELYISVFRPSDTVAHYREDTDSMYDVYEQMDDLL
jgi:Uncharacterized conserved protein